jgi:hypothetical protein
VGKTTPAGETEMSRIASALLGSGIGPAQNYKNPMLDLTYGGMHGWAPKLDEWVNNQQYIRQNVIPILLEAPTGFKFFPNPDVWISTLRSLMELHSLSITGLNAGLEVEFASTPVGGSGQQQEDPTDVKETPSAVTHRWNEKYGMPVVRFWSQYIRYLLMDANSKFAGITTLAGAKGEVTDMLADRRSFSMLYIEPDPTHTQVVKSWIVTNMMPKSSGEITGQHDKTAAGEPVTYDIAFTGIHQTGWGVQDFAQEVLDGMNITGADPYARAAFIKEISADVTASTNTGYKTSIDKVVENHAGT